MGTFTLPRLLWAMGWLSTAAMAAAVAAMFADLVISRLPRSYSLPRYGGG